MPSFFTSPTVAQQIEKEVSKEAKKEQKELKHVISDLRHVETRDAKAHKVQCSRFLSVGQYLTPQTRRTSTSSKRLWRRMKERNRNFSKSFIRLHRPMSKQK